MIDMARLLLVVGLAISSLVTSSLATPAVAKSHGGAIPSYDIKQTCRNADAFSADFQTKGAYGICIDDESRARRQLGKVWSSYTASQKRQCIEPGPDKSYVEVLTCLQMNPNGAGGSDIGGPIAPGVDFK